jgi:hypothetical protein
MYDLCYISLLNSPVPWPPLPMPYCLLLSFQNSFSYCRALTLMGEKTSGLLSALDGNGVSKLPLDGDLFLIFVDPWLSVVATVLSTTGLMDVRGLFPRGEVDRGL